MTNKYTVYIKIYIYIMKNIIIIIIINYISLDSLKEMNNKNY